MFCLLFGTIAIIYVLISYPISPILQWIICEIKFWYRFKFTDFWDKILLDDDYSEDYKSREEKLEKKQMKTKTTAYILGWIFLISSFFVSYGVNIICSSIFFAAYLIIEAIKNK